MTAIAEALGARISLDDKYRLARGRVFATGVQALVRLPIEQARRDAANGLRVGTLISGYPGSPLGGYDIELSRAGSALAEHDVVHVPGVNEEVAAGTVWGTQMLDLFGHRRFDGATGLWYGKSPGVDRAGDVFRHANLGGGARHSALVALVGDDPAAKSSTIPNASELTLSSFGMPVVFPGSVQEILDLGLLSIAMARATGLWVAMKLVTNLCDGGASIEVGPERGKPVPFEHLLDGQPFAKPSEFKLLAPASVALERDLHERRLVAAQAFARANGMDRIEVAGPRDRIGIVAAGKTFADVRQALTDLGLDDLALRALGIRLLRLGLVHPVEPTIVAEFADGLERVLVVEEKRELIESQLRSILYDRARRPEVVGKHGRADGLPRHGELDADLVAEWLAPRLGLEGETATRAEAHLDRLRRARARGQLTLADTVSRLPNYCSGCPHSRSTLHVEDEFVGGGIGCHGMALFQTQPERAAAYITPMGVEGTPWLGARHFVEVDHVVQNLGDGTFFHSGSQAVRAACWSGAPITFKLLFNSAVAMTGGQDPTGGKDLAELTRLLEVEGVRRTIVVSEQPADRRRAGGLAANATVVGRDGYDDAVRTLAAVDGPTVLVYDQQCAAEKRRLRKRGRAATPARRIVINTDVCEGCGDCGDRSNCMSVVPVDTDHGRKTQIHQSSCNQDYSCLEGDCPSFLSVYVRDGEPKPSTQPRVQAEIDLGGVAEPVLPPLDRPYRIYIPGIGGTGVVTLNQIIGYAAMIDGRGVTTLDQTGLAQKGGAVLSNIAIFDGDAPASNKVGLGQADLVLLLDLVAAGSPANLQRCDAERTAVVGDLDREPTATAIRDVFAVEPGTTRLMANLDRCTRAADNVWLHARDVAETLFHDHMATNLVVLGAAYQAGLVPVSGAAIESAIELNGVAVARNTAAFRAGRLLHHDPSAIVGLVAEPAPAPDAGEPRWQAAVAELGLPEDLAALVGRRATELAAYQADGTARGYLDEVAAVWSVDRAQGDDRPERSPGALTEAVARNLAKLLAYKDEYEVARLLVDRRARERARAEFGEGARIAYNLHPPFLRALGRRSKLEMRSWWATPVLHGLAGLRRLRGTAFDPFGRTAVRRLERDLIEWYRASVRAALTSLPALGYDAAVAVASAPDHIRGFEHLKVQRASDARAEVAAILGDG